MVLRRDPKLQEALRHSRRVGDMLLKVEEQEVAKVNQLTDDLLKKEYRQGIVDGVVQSAFHYSRLEHLQKQ